MKNSFLFLIIVTVLITSCTGNSSLHPGGSINGKIGLGQSEDAKFEIQNYDYDKADMGFIALTANADANSQQSRVSSQKADSKIVKTANVSFQVDEFESAKSQVKDIVSQYDGVIMDEDQRNYSGQVNSRMTIRVPAARFDSLLSKLEKVASYVHHKHINAQDITEEYFDLQTRLNTKKEVENRYLQILEETKTIEEILKVESHLASIREEIEAAEGKLKYMNDRVSYSTIHLDFHQKLQKSVVPGQSFAAKMGKAVKGGWAGLQEFVIGITYTWPFIIMLFAVLVLLRKWWKNRKQRKVSPPIA